ncbi:MULTISPECIES: cytochrome c oxidase subunit 4 [Streptomyces]|uniref:cytochrome-c oxidase n=1 Tax=Streptomyces thinghirensis TaxID=551547 RepID=A0ABP9SZX8_9ACTN|nr:cytochrome c oxidase subunit 4 [Streptomyces sp. BB1-1-1]WND39255.1 cytochrome c oxidase subunit 4 [Streptomyces sp. BB1-1-1]
MRTEARLFTGVAAFFAVTAAGYGWFSEEPAGTAALTIAFLMASLVAFFLRVQYRKRGLRAQDRGDAEVLETAGPLEFFPPHSPWPIVTALGAVVLALGIVYGLWLALIGFGVLALAVLGLVFQYAGRGAQRSSSPEDDSGPDSVSPTSTRSP